MNPFIPLEEKIHTRPLSTHFGFLITETKLYKSFAPRPRVEPLTARPTSNVIEPSQSIELQIRFGLYGRWGFQRESVSIHSNDPLHPEVLFSLEGTVSRQVDLRPSRLFFDPTSKQEEQRLEAFITSPSNAIQEVRSTHPAFQLYLKTLTEGEHYSIRVTMDPSRLNQATHAEIILLLEDGERIPVPLFLKKKPPRKT